jgi:hypothetical protein
MIIFSRVKEYDNVNTESGKKTKSRVIKFIFLFTNFYPVPWKIILSPTQPILLFSINSRSETQIITRSVFIGAILMKY